jgi:hypothetical protein
MDAVVEFISDQRVNDAGNDYTEYARMLSEDGTRLTDRAFHEEFTRRYDRWRKLFLMQDAR